MCPCLGGVLGSEGLRVIGAAMGGEALARASGPSADLVLLDCELPAMACKGKLRRCERSTPKERRRSSGYVIRRLELGFSWKCSSGHR
jgi:CheY-like chemotaxis protein